MAGRRTSLASLAGQKVDDVPGKSDPLLLTLALNKLVPTRFNPRRNFGSEEDLKEFGQKLEKRQLQPAVVVSRAAYLKLWPEEADHVGTASYVIANGERRYRASRSAGLQTLDVVHNEDVAKSRADFLDAILSENNDREDLDPIERALGIETMVKELGGADQVAEYYGKTKGWVSQQRKLLKLTDDLQALVSAGDIPVRVARDIAGLPHSEQQAAWEAEQQRRDAAKAAPRQRRAPRTPDPKPASGFTAVNQRKQVETTQVTPAPQGVPPQVAAEVTAGRPQESANTGSSQPHVKSPALKSTPSTGAGISITIPSRQPADVAEALASQLTAEELAAVTELLLDKISSGVGVDSPVATAEA
ncbi:ParB/RepB/Spo0J family partition protein [Streptomyces sp. NPDC021100]|uniref:ParB/RepB/Spo0J family partition protein n=1 Tax=Streptomyces sp. NPDC021100 TaxID=3365114 RepID=UPI00378AEB16